MCGRGRVVSGLGPAVSLCKGQGRALRQVASGQVPLYRKVGIATPISSIPGPRSTTISLSLRAKESLEKTLGCNGKRRAGSREIWVLLSIRATTCCMTVGKIFTLPWLQFPLLQKQTTRVCSCHNLMCCQKPGVEGCVMFKIQVPGPHA